MKRFFKTDWGIDYTVVARDEEHAHELIRQSDPDYAETLVELGGPPIFDEIPIDRAKQIAIYDETVGEWGHHVPLADMELGAVMSTEFA